MTINDMQKYFGKEIHHFVELKMNRESDVNMLDDMYEDLFKRIVGKIQDDALNSWLDENFENLDPDVLLITSCMEGATCLDMWVKAVEVEFKRNQRKEA